MTELENNADWRSGNKTKLYRVEILGLINCFSIFCSSCNGSHTSNKEGLITSKHTNGVTHYSSRGIVLHGVTKWRLNDKSSVLCVITMYLFAFQMSHKMSNMKGSEQVLQKSVD